MKISRRDATIGGATLLAGSSINTLAQAERPLKRAIGDVEERDEVVRAKRLTPKELASRTIWNIPAPPIAVKTEFLFQVPNYFDVDARGITLASFFGPVAKLGAGSFYFSTYYDKSGGPLSGERNYRLHVPANVPASEFWAVTVYDLETEAFFLNSTHLTIDSLDKAVQKNTDGSV